MQTYKPNPIDTSHVVLPEDLMQLMEQIAENVHENWAAGRMAEGWVYGVDLFFFFRLKF